LPPRADLSTREAHGTAIPRGLVSRGVKPGTATVVATLFTLTAWLPASAAAQGVDGWQFDASLYLYLPSVGGETLFGQGGSGSEVRVDSSKLLDTLQKAFMGSLEARRGPWGVFTDFVYVDFGDAKSGTRDLTVGGVPLPADVSASVDFGLRGSAWTLAGVYRAVPDRTRAVDLFAGARLLDIKQTLSWQLSGNVGSIPTAGRGGDQQAEIRNWDAIVGVKGRLGLGAESKWFVPYYLDVGTGDSDLTWQAMAGIGYAFGGVEIVGTWRYLDYRMKSPKVVETLNFSGPAVAAVFHW